MATKPVVSHLPSDADDVRLTLADDDVRLTLADDDVRLTPGRSMILLLTLALIAGLGVGVLSIPVETVRQADTALNRTPDSGVANPVTAVLLNFRGYDTLLEVAVLLLAVIGIWSAVRVPRLRVRLPDSPLLSAFVRLVLPLMIIVAGYLLWIGADAPGGAFQGGAILGGLGVLWIAAAPKSDSQRWAGLLRRIVRPLLVLGVGVFLLVSAALLVIEGRLLEYPPAQTKNLLLLIESAAMISIGLTLTLLFVGGAADEPADSRADASAQEGT